MLDKKSAKTALLARKKLLLLSTAAVLVMLQAKTASATTLFWDAAGASPATPAGGTGTWNTSGAAWSNATTDLIWSNSPGTDTAVFGGTAGTVTLSGTLSANAVAFNTSGYNLTGGTLNLLGTTPTFFVNANANIASAITGTGGILETGTGILSLNTASTFTGGTTVSRGTLQLGNASAVGNTAAQTITLNDANTGASNTTLQFNVSGGTWANAITIANLGSGTTNIQYLPVATSSTWTTGTITLNGAATLSLPNISSFCQWNSPLTGTGNLTISSTHSARLILNSASPDSGYSGNIEVQSGSILEPRSELSSPTGNSVTVDSGGELRIQFSAASIDALNGAGIVDSVSGAATLTVGKAGGSGTFSGVMKNNGSTLTVIKAGGGTQILTGINTYTGATTISGGVIQLGDGTATHDGSLASATLTDNAALVYNINGTSYSYSGTIAGSGSVTKMGPGNVTLSHANSYSGGTNVSAGNLYINAAFTGTGLTSVTGGVLGGTGSLPGTVNVSGGSIEAGQSGTGQFTLGGLHFTGTGSMNFGTLANYASTAGFNVSGSNLYDPGSTAGAITINVGSLLGATGGSTYKLLTYTGANADNALLSQYTLASLPSRTPGTLANNFNTSTGIGEIDLTLGTIGSVFLIWTGNQGTSWSAANNWNLSSGSGSTSFLTGDTVVFDDTASPNTAVNMSSGNVTPSSVTFNNNTSTYVLSGTNGIAGVTGLTLNGTGTVQLTSSNTFSGPVAVNAGILNVQNSGALGTSTGVTVANGATLQLQNGITVAAVPLTISGNGALNQSGALVNLGGSNTYSGTLGLGANSTISVNSGSLNLSGTGNINGSGFGLTLTGPSGTSGILAGSLQTSGGTVTKTGGGVWTLSGISAYSGGTTVSNGTLILGSTTAAGTGPITINDANTGSNNTTLQYNVSGGTWANGVTVSNQGSGTTTIQYLPNTGGNFTWSAGAITLNGAATLSAPNITGNLQFNSTLTGAGNLILGSTNTHRFILNTTGGADSGFTGNIDVQSGAIFEPRAELASSTGNSVTVETGGELRIQFANASIDALNGSGLVDSVSGAATLTVGKGGGSGTFSGVMENNGSTLSFALAGGSEILTGSNTFSGGTTISGGTLQLGDGTTSAHDGSLSATGGINNNAALVYNIAGTQTYAGVISGSGTVTKMGPGTVVLSGSNTYSGGTNVSAGKLYINAPSNVGGPVSVAGAATLGGTGTLSGNVAMSSGGILEAGQNGLGSLTLGGLTFNGSGTINIGLVANYASTPAISVTGSGAYDPGSTAGAITINVANLVGSSLTTYRLLTYTGSNADNIVQAGTSGFQYTLGTLPLGDTASLVNNYDPGSGNGEIDLTINTISGISLVWTGLNGTSWDTTTTNNWNLSSGGSTSYQNGNPVVFDDTASPRTTVNIGSPGVTPSLVTFNNNTSTYLLTGANGISGSAALNLNGLGTVQLNNSNGFAGPVAVNAGVLSLANSGAVGSSSGITVAPGATLQLQNGITVGAAIPLTIGGTGALNQSGALVNLSGINTYAGLITLTADSTIAVNSGNFNVSNTGAMNGSGFNLTLAGASGTIGVLSSSVQTGGGTLTKNGNGTWVLSGSSTYSGGTTVNGGTLIGGIAGFGGAAPGFGTGPITVNAGAILTGTVAFSVGGDNNNTRVVNLNGGTWNMDYAAAGGEYVSALNMVGGTVSTTNGSFFRVPFGGLTISSMASNTSSNITAGIDLTRNNIVLNVAQGTVPNGQDLVISGSITQNTGISGAAPRSLTMNGNGTLVLNGNNNYTGGTTVTGGTLILASAGAFPAVTNGTDLILNQSGASVPTVIAVNHGGSPPTVLQVNNLSMSGGTSAWTGLLDLNNNAMIVHTGSISTITNQVQQGFNAGGTNWQGSGGIASSTAAANPTHLTALGVIVNDDGTNSSTPLYTTLDSAPTVDGDVLVKYTYFGDANLDGKVDGTDYSRIDNGILTGASGWFNGDFNYDGVIDGSDYTLIDNAFNTQGASLAAAIATAQIAGSAGTSAVPEPTTLGLLGIGVAGLLGRRIKGRRHSH